MNKLSILGVVLAAAGIAVNIGQDVIGDKQQKETIREEVNKALAEKENSKDEKSV